MQTIEIAEGIFRLVFAAAIEEGADTQDNTLTMLRDGDRALLIDTAFPAEAHVARSALEAQGIRPEVVLLSHFHPDHCSGAVAFEDCEIIAHPAYRYSYDFYQEVFPDQRYAAPSRLVQDGEHISFGRFTLELLSTPGHSPDGLTTLINGQIAHIGDLLAYDSDGRMTFPLIASGGDFSAFIASLERLNTLDAELFVPVHGPVLRGRQTLAKETGQVIHYLQRMLAARGDAPLEELLDFPPERYGRHSHHEKNLKRLRKILS
jgi:glyoxylase-like metal-dependent hydrolase (beta-lactamase superfamily II)